jgi:hypothetical protein
MPSTGPVNSGSKPESSEQAVNKIDAENKMKNTL